MMSDDLDKQYVTINNFPARFSDSFGGDHSMLLGYFLAINTIVTDIKRKIEAGQNFDDLKKELLDTVDGHIQTRNHISNAWENEPDKYGLPPLAGPL